MSEGVVIPWFEQSSFDRGLALLGDEGDVFGKVTTRDEYRLVVEQQLRTIAAVRVHGVSARGVVTIDMDALEAWAREQGLEDDLGAAFEPFFDTQVDAGPVIEWPPGRNDACWCGSGAKYKRCCATLAVNEQLIAERATLLRETVQGLEDEDEQQPVFTMEDYAEVCDEILAEMRTADADARAELVDEVRHEVLEQGFYRTLLEVADASTAHTSADAEADLQAFLAHELMREYSTLAEHLRLVYAEALGASERYAAALDTATAAIERLDSAGEDVPAYDRAIALMYLIDVDGPEPANRAFGALFESSAVKDRPVVCDIAADTFYDKLDLVPAASWSVRGLQLLLDDADAEIGAIEFAARQLQTIYAAADKAARDGDDAAAHIPREVELLERAAARSVTS